MYKRINFFIAVLFVLPAFQVLGQDWHVPAENSAIENPQEYTLENVKLGKDLYMLNCKSCHGEPGKNNPLPLVPVPPDMASDLMQLNTVGDLYYKISTGKGAMPQFETVISEADRWRIVNFIMNYNSGREQLLVDLPPVKAQLLASIDEDDGKVNVFAEYEDKDGKYSKLVDVPVIFSLKKTFGNLEIGESFTDENGRSDFTIPESLIGNEEGYVSIVVSLGEEYEAAEVVLENAKICTSKEVTKLIRQGVIWSTNDNVPMWLLLSYIGMVGGAWLAIAYVVFQIIKIRKYSKE